MIRGPGTARPCAAAPEGCFVCVSPSARAHVPGRLLLSEGAPAAVVVSSAEIAAVPLSVSFRVPTGDNFLFIYKGKKFAATPDHVRD